VFNIDIETCKTCVSMDGKSCWVDNVFVEREWRSVKYENTYLPAYATPI